MKKTSDNDKLRALLKATTLCMNVSNATEILTMFIYSERIYADLGRALAYPEAFESTQHIILRKWVPIDIDMEFRGFVYKNQLNGLSQYNYIAYFERLKPLKCDIEKSVQEFWNSKCKEILKHYENYVIDFAVCGDKLEKIYVIELNPWKESTDGALFSWKNELNVLENGPYELRVIENFSDKRPTIESKYRKLLGWE